MDGDEAIAGFLRAVRVRSLQLHLSAAEGVAGQGRGEVHLRVPYL